MFWAMSCFPSSHCNRIILQNRGGRPTALHLEVHVVFMGYGQMTSQLEMCGRDFLRSFKGIGIAGGTKHTLLCAARSPWRSLAYSRTCSVKEIQPQILQEQLHSSEVPCEYIQYISLISKCQRGGEFTMNIIACYSFLMIKILFFFQFNGGLQYAEFRTNHKPNL